MRALIMALVLATVPASARSEFQEFLEVEWETTATEESVLGNEISELYVILYNSGNLPTREVPMGEFYTPLEAFADSGAYSSSRALPVALDGLLCDLNPRHCSRALHPVDRTSLKTLSFHVGGFATTRGKWTTGPNDTIVIPFVEFEPTTYLKRLPQPMGWTSDKYDTPDNVDCSLWKTTCENIVESFNPYVIPMPNGMVEATIPQPGLMARIRLRADEQAESAIGLKDGFATISSGSHVQTYVDPLSKSSIEWQNEFNSRS